MRTIRVCSNQLFFVVMAPIEAAIHQHRCRVVGGCVPVPNNASNNAAAALLGKKERARLRMEEGRNQYSPVENLPQADTGKTRDKVAEHLGVSGRTYATAEKIRQAAKAGDS